MVHKRLSREFAEAAEALGREVAKRRETLKWSQDELIRQTGHAINKKTLQRVESGRTPDAEGTPNNPELRTLIELSRVLGGRVVIDYAQPIAFTIAFDQDDPA